MIKPSFSCFCYFSSSSCSKFVNVSTFDKILICNNFFFSFFISGVPQRLDAGDLGPPTRYCYLESIYHTWDGGTDHRASLVSHPTQCVAVLGGLH